MPLISIEAEVGSIDTATTGVAVTATVAEADLVLLASLVAVTVYVPVVVGAVYRPLDDTVPPVAHQVTASFLEPVTVAVNCCVPLVSSIADTGEIDTVTAALLKMGLWPDALRPNKARMHANAIAGIYESHFLCMCDVILVGISVWITNCGRNSEGFHLESQRND